MRHSKRSNLSPRASDIQRLHEMLTGWYRRKRRDLPWRATRDPYAIWLSETMLQQTRVEMIGAAAFRSRFLAALPTVQSLAEAPEEQVLGLWSGLGYYRRARMLHAAAKRVVAQHGGRLPTDAAGLKVRLEGVGNYTAGAIASIAFGARAALVDGNVARVLARLFAIADDVKSARGSGRLWKLAEELIARGDSEPGDWNQALMELGATVCKPRDPSCAECPVAIHVCTHTGGALTSEPPRTAPQAKATTGTQVGRRSHVVAGRALGPKEN